MNTNERMSRADFLRRGFLGALGVALFSKGALNTTDAATVRDNLGGSAGVFVGSTAPANKQKLWIDTSVRGRGVVRYWNGSAWSATASVWDD